MTVVNFGNGVEAWLKPTDFKNDQILFSLNATGGASLSPPADYPEAALATAWSALPRRRLESAGSAEDSHRQAGRRDPSIRLSSHGMSGNAAPAELETALQLLYQ